MLFDNDLRITKGQTLADFGADTMTAMGAAFDEAWRFNPTNSISRNVELRQAQRGEVTVIRGDYGSYDPSSQPNTQIIRSKPASPMLSREDAEAKVKENSLKLTIPEQGITQDALNILMDRKKEELMFNFQQNSAPKGFIPSAAKFSAALAASVLDPINIASAFIPVVGQGRYAAMLAARTSMLGRAGVRAGVGVLEGAVGAAIVEPIVYSAATQEQADYDMMDSVFNVLVGGVMGGGLHAGAGAISDAIKLRKAASTAEPTGSTAQALSNASQETKDAMLRTAITNELTGYRANVDPIAAFDSALNPVTRAIRNTEVESFPKSMALETDGYTKAVDMPQEFKLNTAATDNPSKALEAGYKETYNQNNARNIDVAAAEQADIEIAGYDENIDLSISSINDEIMDTLTRQYTTKDGITDDLNVKISELNQLDIPVQSAELDAKALEAAMLCRIQL